MSSSRSSSAAADFRHLHVHSEYSLLDGASRISDLVKRALNLGQDALALTDHGNMFGAIEFYKTCKELSQKAEAAGRPGIKPLIGLETYIVPRGGSRASREKINGEIAHHLILLARNEEGYKNLLRLSSRAYAEGFYYRPRVDRELLAEYAGGLLGLSACLKGEIASALRRGDTAAAREAAGFYREALGPENFYFELQDHRLPEQKKVNEGLLALAKEFGAQAVVSNDSHYTDRDDAEAHDVLLCIGTGKLLSDPNRMRFSGAEYYLKSGEEMLSRFGEELSAALRNTREVAERCELKLTFGEYHYPKFPVPKGRKLNAYFRALTEEGLHRRYGEKLPDTVRARADEELRVLTKMGFDGYLLIVWDIIREAKRRGIPVGPGRGSAAGSIVCYALGITDLDPLAQHLLFERFVNEGRNEMPDIDIDLCQSRRSEILEYVQERYGRDHTAGIITFSTMLSKGAVRDVGRVLNYPLPEVDRLAKLIPGGPRKVSLAPRDPEHPNVIYVMDDVPELRELYAADPQTRRLVDLARKIEGLVRNAGRHAAGMVVADKPLTEYSPLYRDKEGALLTQYEMSHIDSVGLLKIDLLGLETLTVIALAVKFVREMKDENFDLENLPLDDADTYRLLACGGAKGVFQFESEGMQRMLREAQPDRLEDLIALNAMYRPGPMDNLPSFIARKHGREKPNYLVPQLEPILRETYGIIVYQEQVMRIAHELAGFTLSEADSLRKAMGKKNKDLMEKYERKFTVGCVERGIAKAKAKELYSLIEKFASYGFNKSHAAAYALVAYRTAYLKAHYPAAFMAALLTLKQDSTDKMVEYIEETRRLGLTVLPPDINRSGSVFLVVDDKQLCFSLGAIKGVGSKAVEAVVAAREKGGPFRDLYDFCERVDGKNVNKTALENLIRGGAFDALAGKGGRGQLFMAAEDALAFGTRTRQDRLAGQGLLFGGDAGNAPPSPTLPNVGDWSPKQRLDEEKKALGFYFSGHPLERVRELVEGLSARGSRGLATVPEGFEVLYGGFVSHLQKKVTRADRKAMAVLTLEDFVGGVSVVVFPRTYEKYAARLRPETVLFVRGRVRTDSRPGAAGGGNGGNGGEPEDGNGATVSLIADELLSLEEAATRYAEAVTVVLGGAAGAARPKTLEERCRFIESRTPAVLEAVKANRGRLPLFFQLEVSDEKGATALVRIRAGGAVLVAPTESLLAGLRQILGPASVYVSAAAVVPTRSKRTWKK